MAGSWLLTVCAYKFVGPPVTPLMVMRKIQSFAGNSPTKQAWTWIPLTSIPLSVQQVVVAAEDARFMEHWGIDVGAIGDVFHGARRKARLRGASTITMQTVKNVFLWPGRSYIRKCLEGLMAPIAGLVWGKKRTLEIYVNVVEWGDGIYGIEAAAQKYFQRPARRLKVHEAAALASILPNPRGLSPHVLSIASRKRVERILREWRGVRVPITHATNARPR